ncbi:hypothetical protein M1M27_gp13 [Cellulophaga phage Ingeline_1]|uniref:Lipoprotein n=1 Tax=Cellulophaga phage Ingeline_1 TaxID=2745674 RepID=A0A8E4ZL52_9CAUD|nr:hypothetical protein M1M27_gp13 [Cellulophaga phage Ingeline_1]QQV90026.1 hypothetical protein Ingeline2_38 [Cellulophaga phage Ingeline_2]QQV90076.1 hypothetical protein Ingeline3_38 [Cellulophaga phage Ingeline_3]QQV90126.1 hypothetical protein Ingeline4_38 [Cellulophaga phage Ingeline_4]QQV90175.1 hypothetical protein Ingeline5_37 [Cellulophaga phage Ingeline_5]QQV90275.1 hypothetical protein Ingeline7_38 [Cellulophaga phage Ingeline_7]QQV90306.1 hypothetical protein Ingeline8_13 [Cellu
MKKITIYFTAAVILITSASCIKDAGDSEIYHNLNYEPPIDKGVPPPTNG